MPTLKISLNGTDSNPWHKLGLTQNPFPQLARYETDRFRKGELVEFDISWVEADS